MEFPLRHGSSGGHRGAFHIEVTEKYGRLVGVSSKECQLWVDAYVDAVA